MSKLLVRICVTVAALLVGAGIATAQFDGSPSTPLSFQSHSEFAGWDVQVHSRNQETWSDNGLTSIMVDHGADCAGPPNQHESHSYSTAVYVCRDHLMTSMGEGGYGLIALTPNKLVDFSNGTATIRWDMSTYRSSDRDWVDFWVTPWEDNLALPFTMGNVDLQGPPVRGIQVQMSQYAQSRTNFAGRVFRDAWTIQELGAPFVAMQQYFNPDRARRDVFELQISRTHLKFWMPTYNVVWVDSDFADLGWSQGVFQLAYHSYNPTKGSCVDNCPNDAAPSTFHWDNVSISPSLPFTIVHSDTRALVSSSGYAGQINFQAPAPANSFLRFSAQADVRLSFDGGATYNAVEPQTKWSTHTASYFTPIPQGTRRVDVRFGPQLDGWYNGPFHIKDAAIWSRSQSSGTPASPTPVVNSPTAVPATATSIVPPTATRSVASPTPTQRVSASPTPTQRPPVVSTSTATATATATATTVTQKADPTSTRPPATPTLSAAGWTSSAKTTQARIVRGRDAKVVASVRTNQRTVGLVDVEVYGPDGSQVHQAFFDNVTFRPDATRSFTVPWEIPLNAPLGTYTVKVGVFTPGWGKLHDWNDQAMTFTVTR